MEDTRVIAGVKFDVRVEHERAEGLMHVERRFVHFRVLLRAGDKRSTNGPD